MLNPGSVDDTATVMWPFRRGLFYPEMNVDSSIWAMEGIQEDGITSPADPKLTPYIHNEVLAQIQEGHLPPYIRMANFWITTNPDVVKQRGLVHTECESCQAGVERAVARLAEAPGTIMVVAVFSFYDPELLMPDNEETKASN